MTSKAPANIRFARLRSQAEQRLRATGHGQRNKGGGQTDHLLHEIDIHQLELRMQNEELLRIQSELEKTRDRYAQLYDASPLAYLTISAGGIILEANQTATTLFGMIASRLLGSPLSDFVAPDSQTAYYLHAHQVLHSMEIEECELNLTRADGSIMLVHLNSVIDPKGNDHLPQWITMIGNVTAQLLAGASPVGLFRCDIHGAIHYVNPQWSRITGLSLEKALGKQWMSALHPEDAHQVIDDWKKIVSQQCSSSREFRFVNQNLGTMVWVLGQTSPEWDKQGVLRGFVGTITEITKIKLAEEDLRKSEHLLNTSQSMAHLGSWGWDVAQNAMNWSDEVYRIFGLLPQQFPATYPDFLARVHPLDRAEVLEQIQQALSDPTETYRSEHRIAHPDGSIRLVLEQGEVIRDPLGAPLHLLCTIQDITATRLMENELFNHKERFKKVFECSSLGIGIASLDGVLFESNAALRQFLGRTADELHGLNVFELPHPKDRDLTSGQFKELHARNIPFGKVLKRYLRQDGQVVWGDSFVSAVHNPEGDPIFVFIMVQDVTHRKDLEQALSRVKEEVESRERQRLARTIHDGAIQMLQVVLLSAKSMLSDLRRGQGIVPTSMDHTCREIIEVIQQLRDLSTDLHPSFLDRMDLVEAIRWRSEKLARQSGVEVCVETDENLGHLERQITKNAYFIFQEAVINAIKHAKCTLITVRLQKICNEEIHLNIVDDGQGFDVATIANHFHGIGLMVIQERTARMHGEVDFFSVPGLGTTVSIRIPIHD
ncbi:MAG: PAS domain S-box protein [Magnetococcales bacterium]|nr:PAS domain S-box protein [Magnetococcales bacterium]